MSRGAVVAYGDRVQIRSFVDDDVPTAALLLAGRHRRDRMSEPLLSPEYEDPRLCEQLLHSALDPKGEGGVALESGRAIGYLLAVPGDGELRGRHVWSRPEHHARGTDASPEVVRHRWRAERDGCYTWSASSFAGSNAYATIQVGRTRR